MDQPRLRERALAAVAIGAQKTLDMRNALQQLRTRIPDVATEISQAHAHAAEAEARRASIRAKFLASAEQTSAQARPALARAEQALFGVSDRQSRTEVRAPVDGVINRV